MGKIDITGALIAQEPFVCISCGETFRPPSLYFWISYEVNGKEITGKICLVCERYS